MEKISFRVQNNFEETASSASLASPAKPPVFVMTFERRQQWLKALLDSVYGQHDFNECTANALAEIEELQKALAALLKKVPASGPARFYGYLMS